MDPVRGAYYLLKAHLLHYDAPRQTAKAAARQPANGGGPATGTTTTSSAQSGNPTGIPAGDSKQRLFGGRGAQGASEVARFISEHIHAIRNADPSAFGSSTFTTSNRSNTRTASRVGGSGETNTTRRDKLTHDLEYALFCLHKSHERFPSPRLSLLELTRAMATHMVFHKNNQGVVNGEYIMKALMLFFGVDKQDALSRYIGPLVNCGCLRPTAASKGVRTVNDVEKSGFYVQVPAELREIHRLFDFRESASRLVCIYCTRAVEDGANELIYLSHSRWLFGEPPSADVAASKPIDDPCGMFPEQFRRGFVGPLFQFISSFCLSECRMFETLHDQCAIIRLNGVKMVVAQLFPCNIPPLVLDPESGKKARCDTPVVLMMGLPERIPNNVIHMSVKKILDSVEMSIGPRSMFGTDLPSDVFREEVRRLGAKIFSLATHLFFSMEIPDCTFETSSNAQEPNRRELGGLLDNGVMDQVYNATRTKRPINGFPTRVPFALNHRTSTHPLSRKSCSSATQILLSLRDTCAAFGGCVCSAMFYHGALVLSDTHPYVTALLGLFVRLSLYKAQPVPQMLINTFDGDVTQAATMAHLLSRCCAMSSECSTGFPVRDQLPAGMYADTHFGEPTSRSGAHASPQGSPGPGRSDPPTPASPNGASPRHSEGPSSPTHGEAPAYSGARSPSTATNDEESSLLPSHLTEQTLYPGYCFLSEELVALLPKPAKCPRNQRADSDKYDCHDPLSPNAPIELMEPGFYHTVHLSANGVDIILILPEVYSAAAPAVSSPAPSGTFPSPSSSVQESIRATFQEELSSLGREISSLSTQLSRSDTIPREVDLNPDGGNSGDNEGGVHVDPAAGTGRDNGGSGSSPANHAAPGGSGATTMQTVQSALSSSLCAVHDLALGVTEFVDGSLGSQEEIAHFQRVVPSALMLNRATVFLKEANVLSQLLGTSFRQPLRHPDEDNGAMDPPFAIEPTTRVILGRSAFADRDRRGPHAVIYARQSGGQQVFFGVPTSGAASTTSQFPATLRHVEEQYVQFVSSSRSHTVVI
jgi:hypothetical protein